MKYLPILALGSLFVAAVLLVQQRAVSKAYARAQNELIALRAGATAGPNEQRAWVLRRLRAELSGQAGSEVNWVISDWEEGCQFLRLSAQRTKMPGPADLLDEQRPAGPTLYHAEVMCPPVQGVNDAQAG